MKKNRVMIALLPILILICVPIQNQNLHEEETNDSVSQLLRLQKIEDLEITDFIEKENQESFVSTSLADTSNSENKPQKTVLLGGKGINKAVNSIQGVTAYVESSPIEILNNSAFGLTGYNFNGNGQSDNPYQITGYNITDSSTTLIHIENTTAYFRIANNYLNGSGGSSVGIDWENVTNGLIENNTVCNIFDGIILDESHHNTIFNNSFIDTPHDGLALQDSSNYNNITNNVILDCGRGISLSSSDNNTVWNNTINDASYTGDITLYSSNYNVMLNNTLSYAYSGILLESSSQYNILSSNTIFYQTSQGIRVQDSSNNNSIIDNTIYNITDSTGSGSGVYIDSSHNNTLSGNTIYNITDSDGITLSNSTYNTLHDNAIFECFMRGISLVSSCINNTILTNKINDCNTGVYVTSNNNSEILRNTIHDCAEGIRINNAFNNEFSDNTMYNFEGGTTGIAVSSSDFNHLINNSIYNCTNSPGISLIDSHNNSLSENNITYCVTSQGIYLLGSDNNTIQNNTISMCFASQGIYLYNSNNCSISLNVIRICNWGIYIYSSSDNTLFSNNILSSPLYGLSISNDSAFPANNNLVEWNTFINNRLGFPQQVYIGTSTSGNILRYNYYDDHISTDTNNDGFFDTPHYADPSPSADRMDSYPRTHPYFYHKTLYIVGNEDFETLGFPGNGTFQNPYLINNYYFVNTSLLALIYIQDTNVYFRITSNILNGFDQNYNCIELNNVSHGTIDNNIICNTTDHGIGMDESSYNIISNNFIHYSVSGPIMLQYYSENNTINNNTIHDSDGGGIWLGDYTSHNILSNNTINSCYGSGILLYNSANYNQVLNNTIFNCYTAGIEISSSSNNNTFSNNRIEACYYMIHVIDSSYNNFISNTLFTTEDGDIIFLESSNYNTFSGNNITDGYLNVYGIRLLSSNYTTITHNSIYECVDGGILLDSSSYANISYNNIYNNSNYAISLTGSSNNNIVTWNNFINSITGNTPQAFDEGSDNNFSYNYWDEWTTPDVIVPYGIVDIWYNLDGSTNNNDTFPLTTPVLPTIFILSPFSQDYGTDTITVTLSGYVEYYWYYITGDLVNQTWTVNEDHTLTDGTYTLHAYGNDTLGNTAYISVTFTIDTTPPTVSITSPTNSTTFNQNNITLIYTVSDGTVTIYLNGYANNTAIPSGQTVNDIPDGIYNLTIVSVDQAGNIGKATIIGTIDTTSSSSSSTTSSDTTSKNGSFPGIFTLVIFFTLPVVVIRRYRRKEKK